MVGAKPRKSYRNLFKKSWILPLPCEYIFLRINFIVNYPENVKKNSAARSNNTRNKYHLSG